MKCLQMTEPNLTQVDVFEDGCPQVTSSLAPAAENVLFHVLLFQWVRKSPLCRA